MDNDDELAPSALHEFYQKIKKEGSDIIYSDMDIIDAKGKTRDPLCKPDWSPDLFLSQMYLGHLIGFKKSLFEKVGGFRGEFNGSQDYDLLLRMTEMTDKIGHVLRYFIIGEIFRAPQQPTRSQSHMHRQQDLMRFRNI